MITRIEVDGFKSLRDFAIDLEPFTVLIGPNSAGKSNVLDALALLSRLVSSPIDIAFKGGRGRILDQFTRHGEEVGRTIRFAVEMLVPGLDQAARADRFRYEFVIARQARSSGTERLSIQSERLRPLLKQEDSWMSAHPELEALTVYAQSDTAIFSRADESGDRSPLGDSRAGILYSSERNLLLQGSVSVPEIYWTVFDLLLLRLIQPDAAHLRELSERIDSGIFARDASNLPSVLADLPAPLRGENRADLTALVPGISSFDVVPEGDSFRIDFELSGGDRLPARIVSDGTLRILALLTALRAEPRPSMLGIEEPENGIYPGRLRALLELLQEASTRTETATAGQEATGEPGVATFRLLPPQILLTTHSPVVLAALRSKPQHLRFVDLVRRDGQLVTRARAVGRSTAPDRGRVTVSPREIDRLLNAVDVKAAE